MRTSNPQIQIEADALAQLLADLPVGATLTYADASKAIARDVTQDARFSLIKARRIAEKQTGGCFASVRGIGIERVATEHLPGVGTEIRRRIGRAAKRGFERLSVIRANDLPTPSRARLDAERSLLGAVVAITAQPVAKKVETLSATGPVPIAKVLEALA